MSPQHSDPPEAKIARAKAQSFALAVGAIVTALTGGALSIIATVRSGDRTPVETTRAAYEALSERVDRCEKNVTRLDSNDQLIKAYVDGVVTGMPKIAINPSGPQRKPVVMVTPPMTPMAAPKPPELSKGQEPPPSTDFDTLSK
jgi:hypothetical protein